MSTNKLCIGVQWLLRQLHGFEDISYLVKCSCDTGWKRELPTPLRRPFSYGIRYVFIVTQWIMTHSSMNHNKKYAVSRMKISALRESATLLLSCAKCHTTTLAESQYGTELCVISDRRIIAEKCNRRTYKACISM